MIMWFLNVDIISKLENRNEGEIGDDAERCER